MRVSALAGCAAAAALVLTGCGGAGGAAASASPTELEPIPVAKPSDMRPLVGRWAGPGGDLFQFTLDGRGAWARDGQRLWTGAAIPEGGGEYRFSWEDGDPKESSYWGVTLNEDGRSLVFGGTGQTYEKVAADRGARRGSG